MSTQDGIYQTSTTSTSNNWRIISTDHTILTGHAAHTVPAKDGGYYISVPSTTEDPTVTLSKVTGVGKIPGFMGEMFIEDDIIKISLEDGEVVDVFDLKSGKQLSSFYKIIAKKRLLEA